VEKQEMKDICRSADIDFEFVVDQSGSVGQAEWDKTMKNIADFWIDVIQPDGAETCGNHVAARKFSSSHKRWHDFKPPPEWVYSKFSSYTEYVKSVFIGESYDGGGTHTADALRRIRIEDVPLTRYIQTFVMVFTDGQSNDPYYNLADQAKHLQDNVDAVYAYGIGQAVNPNELQLIASNDDGWFEMKNTDSYEYVIDKFIMEQGGCETENKKPFRTPNLLNETYGLSRETAYEHHPREYCGTGCETNPESKRDHECIKCSWLKASNDLPALEKYKKNITQVANERCFPASIIAAFISRETRGGVEHLDETWNGVTGWSRCQNAHYYFDHYQRCYGIMHLPDAFGRDYTEEPNTEEGVGSIPYLRQCVDEIIRLIDFMATKQFIFWDEHLQVRAGIAAWDASVNEVYNHAEIDSYTHNQDFSSDIFARAQFFAENGYA